jgi:hypothetical protein
MKMFKCLGCGIVILLAVFLARGCVNRERPEDRLPPGWKLSESSAGRARLIQPDGSVYMYTFDNRADAIHQAHYSDRIARERAGEVWGKAR